MARLPLSRLIAGLRADPGLRANVSDRDFREGIEAAQLLNRVLIRIIEQTGVNRDGVLTAGDMRTISDALWERRNAALWRDFYIGHGNDEGDQETGYHNLQNDGGRLEFMGRNFADTVADAIYHYGFRIQNGRYYNEDGNDNERAADVAGWLNYFLNGRTMVYGSDAAEELVGRSYSNVFAAARNETYIAGGGADSVWADLGNDLILLGAGNDLAGGGDGRDKIRGAGGNDRIWGESGADRIRGGGGDDSLGGGTGNDAMWGDAGADTLHGDEGADRIAGGLGNDLVYGGDGNDRIRGQAGNDSLIGSDGADSLSGGDGRDSLYGGEGPDRLDGGAGADGIYLWEDRAAADTLVFTPGDSGRTNGTIDLVEGFVPGQDRIDLTAFGAMRITDLTHTGNGRASAFFDGTHLRIDRNGDGATDMMVEFTWVDDLRASDFILA
ncbi:calcium-binding protein [Aliigemmobacter aestuarii]|uniref:Calcium-binding protein n=1 Tax=Aliigemmobacter aestuarii TaxID=1445661 RepID=A0A4S3MJT6_9RHOB|nr:calcium-binding protein [Gemmobacter aestuarii]THD82216.1 calcium-binding protein [Gemmobacter aestuarii]